MARCDVENAIRRKAQANWIKIMEKLYKIRFEFLSKKSLVRNIFDTFLASCESEAVPEAAAEQERKILLHNF